MKDLDKIKLSTCMRRCYDMSRGYRLMLLLNGCIGLCIIAASLGFVVVSKRLVDIATGVADGTLTTYVWLMLLIMLLQVLFTLAAGRIETCNEVGMRNGIRKEMFARLMGSRCVFDRELHTGDIVNRLEEDVRLVTDVISDSIPSSFVALVQLTAAFSFLFFLQPLLAWIVVVIMPIAYLLSKIYMKRMRRLTREIRTTDSRVQAHIQENIQHRTLIASLERTSQSVERLSGLNDTLSRQVLERMRFSLFSRAVVQGGFAAGYAAAFLCGIFGLHNGTVTFGMMTAFMQLVVQVQRPIVDLGRQLPLIAHSMASVERIIELMDMPVEEDGEPVRLDGEVGISFSNVTFAYPGGSRRVLNGFTHDFRPATLTALVGETGVGKSTLMRLVLALLTPDSGEIRIYNGEKSVVASPRTRCNLVYVPQGNTLMSGTLRENLQLGKPDATDEEMRHALHVAVADFVMSLPDGLDSRCGEGGVGLSEGQAQRIAIARGLLRPGSILLLDEPTSSLDSETEQILLSRMAAEVHRRTVIVVTHREHVVELCQERCYMTRS
jgi:ABC-type multidrug transport system fused ATPase/permease subunit